MSPTALLLALALTNPFVHAAETNCIPTADAALARVAKVLGLGNGVGHVGGSEVTTRRKLAKGAAAFSIGGGMLAAEDTDGYLSGTSALVEVVLRNGTCKVSSVSVNTGADVVVGE